MKTLMKSLAAIFFFSFVAGTTFAQTEDVTTTCDGTGIPVQLHDGTGAGLHGGGNGVMAQLNENGGVFQTEFRATFTEEQLAIIENLELTRDEKREALLATFTEAQLEMYNNHLAEVAERQALRGSNALSESQMGNAIRKGWQRVNQ